MSDIKKEDIHDIKWMVGTLAVIVALDTCICANTGTAIYIYIYMM